MAVVAHVIGNGKSAGLYQLQKGFKITCNLPPMEIEGVWASCMVDFKMMMALREGSVQVPGEWVLGARPKLFCQQHPAFHMKHAAQIKEFFVELPPYAGNYTNFNCGHMATYYTVKRLHADEIHLYGFDSLFSMDLTSSTDLVLTSDRQLSNNHRLSNIWRPLWENIFKEFPTINFVIHNRTDTLQLNAPNNVSVQVHKK